MRGRVWLTLPVLLAAAAAGAVDVVGYRGDPVPPSVERIYGRGLAYLVKTQQTDGSWSGSRGSEPGVVGVAVLALIAHGEDPDSGPNAGAIRKGVSFIIKAQNAENGYIGNSMYNHGFATLALAEAYGYVDDERIGPALKKAVDLILSSQKANPRRAWRYHMHSQDADVTVTGAQVVALLAARNAGLAVPEEAIKGALDFLRSCASGGGGYGYSSAGGSSGPLAAIGAVLLSLANKRSDAGYEPAMAYLQMVDISARSASYPYYYLYYASQAFFHYREDKWRDWNERNVKTLQTTQLPDGSWNGPNGTTFSTSGALLSLALNYRFLPIYER